MNKYLENIESMEQVGTSLYEQNIPDNTVILQASLDAPITASTEISVHEDSTQSTSLYEAPKKVSIRIYRLRK